MKSGDFQQEIRQAMESGARVRPPGASLSASAHEGSVAITAGRDVRIYHHAHEPEPSGLWRRLRLWRYTFVLIFLALVAFDLDWWAWEASVGEPLPLRLVALLSGTPQEFVAQVAGNLLPALAISLVLVIVIRLLQWRAGL